MFCILHLDTGKLTWKWGTRSICRMMCPRYSRKPYKVDFAEIYQSIVMLEEINCTKIEAELLYCSCQRRRWGWNLWLLGGLNGEMYQMERPFERTACNDSRSFTIKRTIIPGDEYKLSNRRQSLRLWGVERIFKLVVLDGFEDFHQELGHLYGRY